MGLVCTLLQLYIIAIFARIILDLIRVPSAHPVGQIRSFLGTIVDPLLIPLRRVIPGIPIGQARLDLSPIVLIIGLQIVGEIICNP